MLKPVINQVASYLTQSGTIQRGHGAGLHFDAKGCNPGYLTGTSEPVEQALVARYSSSGGVVYDLGANAGFYAVIAAKCVGSKGRVYAFEPTPTLAQRIRSNANANHFDQIEVVEAAVCDFDGEVSFGVVGELSVKNSLMAASSGDACNVKAITLDTFSQTSLAPNLILMDIEGGEVDALRGGMQLIAKQRPVMMIEVHWLGDKFTDFFHTMLRPLGYTMTTYSGDPVPNGPVRYHALLLPANNESSHHIR